MHFGLFFSYKMYFFVEVGGSLGSIGGLVVIKEILHGSWRLSEKIQVWDKIQNTPTFFLEKVMSSNFQRCFVSF